MADITPEAQHLITKGELGTPITVYKLNPLGGLIIGTLLIATGIGSFWLGASMLFLPPELSLFHIFNLSIPDVSLTSPLESGSGPFFTIFGFFFLVYTLLIGVLGFALVLGAILNRNNRAVFCTNGVAYVTPKFADAFRWEQVLTTTNKVSASSDTDTSRTYTVHCHDGRKFAFDGTLANMDDLAEQIEVAIARQRVTH
jgi:hypothetical protein